MADSQFVAVIFSQMVLPNTSRKLHHGVAKCHLFIMRVVANYFFEDFNFMNP